MLFKSKSNGSLLAGGSSAGEPSPSKDSKARTGRASGDWEILDGTELNVKEGHADTSKKPPPMIKVKPRKSIDLPSLKEGSPGGGGGGEGKKFPILPSAQMSSLANVLKGPTKAEKVSS